MVWNIKTRPEAIEADLDCAAVMVVDMQNAFSDRGGVFDLMGIDTAPAAQTIRVIRTLLEEVRKKRIVVVYLKMGYKEDLSDSGGPDSPNWHKEYALRLMRSHPDLKRKLLTRGTWGFEIVDDLKPHPADLVVVKSRYSGFTGTNLDSLLRSRNIRYLFFVGMATNVCVESTLRDAYCLDYWPVLITDATLQAGPEVLQEATVQNVENHFGWTITAQEFLESLQATS